MQNFSMQSPALKRAMALRALVFEVGVIIFLIIAILFVLNYFKIIDIASFLPSQKADQTALKNQVNTPVATSKIPASGFRASSDIVQRYYQISTNSAVTSSVLHTIYQGVIADIAFGGYDSRVKLDYGLMLKIKGKGDVESQMYYSKLDMRNVKAVQKKGDNEVPIDISSLKIGDTITLDHTEDKMKSPYFNVINARIIKN